MPNIFNLQQIINTMRRLAKQKFYGKLELTFKGGGIVFCQKIEQDKPGGDEGGFVLLDSST